MNRLQSKEVHMVYGLDVYWISSIYIDGSYCLEKTYFDVYLVMCLKFYFYQNLAWDLLSKTKIYHLQCVLDSIHTLYASNVFQISNILFLYLYKFEEKIETFELMCVYLSISKLNYPYTRSKLKQT